MSDYVVIKKSRSVGFSEIVTDDMRKHMVVYEALRKVRRAWGTWRMVHIPPPEPKPGEIFGSSLLKDFSGGEYIGKLCGYEHLLKQMVAVRTRTWETLTMEELFLRKA